LRRGAEPEKALHAGGDQLRKLIASAAQSAIFNAVLAAREASGLLHTFRVGDVGCTAFGAPFLLTEDALMETNRRAAPGVFDAFTTGPLPGNQRLKPDPSVDAEERAWSAATHMDWSWFSGDAVFSSPGERRPFVVPFRSAPSLRTEADKTWMSFALPSGAYATMVLEQLGIALPEDRRG
jgi:tRNA(Glu) U13 pseudouridine synthase TruD